MPRAEKVAKMTKRKPPEQHEKRGRPTTYRPEYCETIVELCGEGRSLTAYAGHIGVARDTITEWASVHPEFSAAVRRAKAACAAWWDERARRLAETGGTGGQATMVMFAMKNHAPDDYRDKQEHEVYGKGGGAMVFRWQDSEE